MGCRESKDVIATDPMTTQPGSSAGSSPEHGIPTGHGSPGSIPIKAGAKGK